jgi:alpha-tubulin suppressor-like RCC1 family protein/formylglycine-generating enzyme required for sulfatase activity
MYLKTDGTLWVIGSNSNGILGAGEQVNVAVPFQIDSDVTSACLGTSTCLYVKDDHTLRASGIREYLALSEPPVNYSTPVMIANDVLDVAAGQFGGHIAYLADSTVVYTVGDNTYGQLASGQVFPSATPVFAAMGGASVFAGENNSFYLAQNGDLFGCGYNGSYILNDGTNTNRSSMQRIALNVSTMANCFSSLLFIDQSGQLYGIGNNLSGKLGDGTTVDKTIPTSIASNVAKVAISEQHSAYITTGKALFTMGNNGYGQLGDGTDTTRLSPVQVATGVSSVAAGNTFTVFVEEETGLLYYTGMFLGHGGMHGMGGYEMSQTPVAILPYVKEVFATGGGVLFLTSDGALYGMGSNYSGQLGGTEENYYTPVRIATHVTKAAGSSSFTVYVQEVYGHLPEVLTQPTGGTYVDGDSVSLSVGTSNAESIQWYHDAQSVAGTGSNTLDLGEVDENDEGFYWASVTNGSGSAYSDMVYVRVNRSGTNPGYYLLGAGSNENGQIGFETENGILVTPTIVDTNVVSVTSGTNHTGYISSSGDLYVMGYNTSGQLGVAGENIIYDPILLAQNVAKVAVGEAHTMYLTTSGTLYVLGRNVEGQLGLGEDTLNRYAPVLLAEGVVDIAAGNFSSYYVTRDGLLYAFGANAMGQLGDGTTTTRRTPVQIASDVIKVASQVDHALYLTSSKVLFGMGRNANYQLGDGTTENKTTPIQIATNVVSMSTGAMDSVYLTSTGVLMGMGRNLHGELGDGTNNPRAFDFEISTGISKASLGTYHLMAISTSGELLGTGQNSSGQLMTGEGSQPVMVLTHSMDDIVDVVGSYDRTFVLSETSNSLPQIVTPPEGGTWTVGDDVELTVTVQSETPVTYQWYTEAGAIENADENTLRIDNVTLNDAGYYWVVVTNDTGSITVPSVQVVVELPIVSAFEPVRELGWKWSLLGWTHDGSFPWVYSWNFDAWFYVYGGLSADVETGFWTYYANSSGTHNGYGYMTPGYWWAYEYRTGAWCAYFEYPLPPDAPEGFEIVQSGSYQMGSPDSEANRDERETLHNVTLTYEFAIQQREVTWQQWTNVRTWALQHGYSDIPAARNGKDGDSSGQHPVTMVNWYDCVKWLNAWSEMEGLEPCYRTSGSVYRSGTPDSITCDWSATGFRLPTEAEWEYACRAGTTGAFNNGAASPEAVAWYSANSGANTHAVGTRAANAWGLYDMHGNVWEWCWDWYGALASTSVSDPTGAATGTSRIIRGGSWYNDAKYCRSAFRYSNYSPFNRYDNVGFRAVIVPEN